MSFRNELTGETFKNEDDYVRSMKQGDAYELSYDYEYISNRFGDGDDDVELAIAHVDVSVRWDDTSVPGYVVSYSVNSPTPIPNQWTGEPSEIFDFLVPSIETDLNARGIDSQLFKDW